jgi:hypothetical protein
VLLGFVVAMAIYVGLGALLTLPSISFARSSGLYVSISFVALYGGGLTAGMLEPKYGVLNGPLVAVLFIAVGAFLTLNFEFDLVKRGVDPRALGPMRIDKVFLTDIPQLFFSSLGGYTAGLIERRTRRPAAGDGANSAR